MIYLAEDFGTEFPADLLQLVQEFEDNWRLTIPEDAVDPIPWLSRYSAGTTLPTYPDADSLLCLVVVLVAQKLDGGDVHVLAALVPTAEMFQRLLLKLVAIYEYSLASGVMKIPLVGVFFTPPRSIIRERDPELFE